MIQGLSNGLRQKASNIEKVVSELKQNKNTAAILLTSRNYIYIGSFLRSVHELGKYSSFVTKIAELQSPIVGLRDGSYYSSPVEFIYPKTRSPNIDKLDLSIIRNIHNDSRKPISEVADDVSSTPNTIRRRLSRLIDEGLIELTIDVYLEESNDLFSFLLITLNPTADRVKVAKFISEKFQPFLMFCWTFSNLPNTLLCWIWTNNLKQLNDLIESLNIDEVESTITDIIRRGYFMDTWIDDLLYDSKITSL